MNTPNPLVPQGALPDTGKAQIRMTVFAILAIHVVLLGVLLIAGCNKKTQTDTAATDTGLPPVPTSPEPWPTPPPTSPAPAQVTHDLTTIPPVPAPAPVTQEVVQPLPPRPDQGVPPPDPIPTEPATTGFVEHTIAKGESFYTLGKKYNVGYKAIAEANPSVNPNRLKIGDKVRIPPPKTPGATTGAGTASAANGNGVKTYKVRSGDNLMKIAKAYGVTVKQLRAANNLRTDQIKVGQTLKIPAKATEPPVEPAPPAVPPIAPPPGNPQ